MNRLVWTLLLVAFLICPSYAQEGQRSQDNSAKARIDSSKLIYHPRLKPKVLTSEQIRTLSEIINLDGMPKTKAWFGRVLFNDANQLTVDVYFEPTEMSPRIAKGNYLRYDSLVFKYREKSESGEPIVQEDDISVYTYVRDPNSTKLELPVPPNLPFCCLTDFTDEEIIEIVAFVRSGPLVKQKTRAIGTSGQRADGKLPIMYMLKHGNDISVRTGTLERSEAGSGQVLEIKKIDSGYELLSISYWLS